MALAMPCSGRILAATVGVTMAFAGLAILAAPSAGAVSCPAVASGTGTVTPAPTPDVDWQGCDLSLAVLYDVDMSGANLSDADLSGAEILGNSNVSDADLAGADLYNATLQANFTGSDLAGANLTDGNDSGSNFTGTDLHAANLTGADLQPATLGDIESGAITATTAPYLPQGWEIVNGYLVGPGGVDFAGQNLTGLVLTNVNLSNSSFAGANLTDANLTNDNLADSDVQGADFSGVTWGAVESGGLTGTPADLSTHWSLVAGYLIGPGAGLALADLAGVNLAGADLAGADLYLGTLAGANLTDADLTGPGLLDDVNTSGAIWSNTTCPDGSNSDNDGGTCVNNNDDYPPSAKPSLDVGPGGADGWYPKVTVAWNWSDPNATINPNECPATTTSSVQGDPATVTATCLNAQGGVGRASVQVKIENQPPAVAVTGVRSGGVYAIGRLPAVRCKTTDTLSGVRRDATLKVTGRSDHGTGVFTASCSGASNNAGISQARPVVVRYTVAYGITGFSSPANHATLRRSARTVTVTFRLTGKATRPVSASLASKLGRRHEVRAELAGPGIARTTGYCEWKPGIKALTCAIRTPRGVRVTRHYQYKITVVENVGAGSVGAPAIGKAVNPVAVRFR
jgi:uncharacterized protein YjbI with pentapeptide repeats